jgi:hypothetical protein
LPYDVVTVGDLLERLAFRLEGRNQADVILRPNYIWALEAAMRELVLDIDMENFRAQANITFHDTISDYLLEFDFRKFIEPSLVYTETPFETMWEVPHQDYDRYNTSAFQQGKSRPRYFMWLGARIGAGGGAQQQIRVVPTPDRDYALRYRYFAYPVPIPTDASDNLPIDPRFPAVYKDALIAGALLHFIDRLTSQEIQVLSRDLEVWKRTVRRNNRVSIGSVYRRKPFGIGAGGRGCDNRHWDGSGMPGFPWNGGSSGPIP